MLAIGFAGRPSESRPPKNIAKFASIEIAPAMVALTVLMIPTVVKSTEEMLKVVPNELREASYALGVRKWRTILKVVIPTAISGIARGDWTSATSLGAGALTTNAAVTASIGQTVFLNQRRTASTTTLAVSPAGASVVGRAVTLTATVVPSNGPGVPTGTVSFSDGTTPLGACTLDAAGVCSIAVSSLAAGAHSLTAAYAQDVSFAGSSSSALAYTITRYPVGIAVSPSANPAQYGATVGFTVRVDATTGAAPTGTVSLFDGTAGVGTCALVAQDATSASCVISSATLAGGLHAITASYGGDATFATATSAALTQEILATPTTTALFASPASVAYGAALTLTASVSSTLGIPAGTVAFSDGTTGLGTCTLSGAGVCSISRSGLSVGVHALTATYQGSGNHSASAGTASASVTAAPTTTTITSSTNPSTDGTSVTWTVRVASSTVTPTGTVTVSVDGAPLADCTLATLNATTGTCTVSSAALTPGTRAVTAAYPGGDGSFGASLSATLLQVVRARTTTSVTSSAEPAPYAGVVRLTVAVATDTTTATGTVTLRDGATLLGTCLLAGGTCDLTTATLALGAHSITASYPGDAGHAGSSSPVLVQTIVASATTTTLSATPSPAPFGGLVRVTVRVDSTTGVPTGTVSLVDAAAGDAPVGSCTLASFGQAAAARCDVTSATLATGDHSLVATFANGAAGTYAGSVSAPLALTVVPAPTRLSIASSANPATDGTSLVFTITMDATTATPAGTVTLADGATPVGECLLSSVGSLSASCDVTSSALRPGTHELVARFAGAETLAASESAPLVQVIRALTTTLLTVSPDPVPYRGTVTFTATVTALDATTAAGTVTIRDGGTLVGSCTLADGACSIASSTLATGPHAFVATYGGDAGHVGSSSAEVALTVAPAATTTTIASSLEPAPFGALVRLSLEVSAATAVPVGTVRVTDAARGDALVGSCTLAAGRCDVTTATLATGAHDLVATYLPSADFVGSASSPLAQTIVPATTTTSLASSANPAGAGETVVYTIAVASATGVPTGAVSLSDGTGATLGACTLAGGRCTVELALPNGAYELVARYAGDGDFAPSASASLAQVVRAATTTGVVSSADPAAYGQSVTLTVTISTVDGSVATGTVSISEAPIFLRNRPTITSRLLESTSASPS